MNNDVPCAIRGAFEAYLRAYFTERDPLAVARMLSAGISGFGTGRNESTFRNISLQTLFENDFSAAPETVDYTLKHCQTIKIAANSGLVMAEMDISTTIAQQQMCFRDLRMSLLFVYQDTHWLIEHLHVSLPTSEHDDDEAYPVKELEKRNTVLTRLVERRTNELNVALAENRQKAITDPLTGLYNRRMLDEQLQIDFDRAQRYLSAFSVLILDIDHFKTINDRFGHLRGDQFLKHFSDIIRQRLRKSDLIGRWGGEEFLVICHGSPHAEVLMIAEDLRLSVKTTDFGIGETRTVSIGVASFATDSNIADLLDRADRGLYQAKTSGRNRVCAG